MKYYSQSNQDKWVEGIFDKKRRGFFLDVGAYDGIQTSNTYYLEQELGWKGICIEANREIFEQLKINRPKAINVNKVVSDIEGYIKFGQDKIAGEFERGWLIEADTLQNILIKCQAPKLIDYLSIDIEGHELTALKNFPFNEWNIGAITIEHNLYMDGPANKDALFKLLSDNGFIRAVEDAPCLDPYPTCYMQPYEDWYIHKDSYIFL